MEELPLAINCKPPLLCVPEARPNQSDSCNPSSLKEHLLFGSSGDSVHYLDFACYSSAEPLISRSSSPSCSRPDDCISDADRGQTSLFLTFDGSDTEEDVLSTRKEGQSSLEAMQLPSSILPLDEVRGHDAHVPASLRRDWMPDSSRRHLFRSRAAPTLFGYNRICSGKVDFDVEAPFSLVSPMSVVSQAFIGLMLYLSVGMLIYTLRGHEFTGSTTNGFLDALYFCIVTMCTIGYGDITPKTPLAKLFSCVFVLVGFGVINILLSAMVSCVLQKQETLLLNSVAAGPHETTKNYLVDVKKGRMRIRSKVLLAFGVVVMCIMVGTCMLGFLEGLGWVDAFYLSCMSVTTVGYGDHSFRTLSGRGFASIWLLVSTLAVAQSFLYLAEARVDKRHRLLAKWVLEKEMTVADLFAADIDNDGSISKSDFVVYKLRQMGKIDEKVFKEICMQFHKLDPEDSGKITISCLINVHKSSDWNTQLTKSI